MKHTERFEIRRSHEAKAKACYEQLMATGDPSLLKDLYRHLNIAAISLQRVDPSLSDHGQVRDAIAQRLGMDEKTYIERTDAICAELRAEYGNGLNLCDYGRG